MKTLHISVGIERVGDTRGVFIGVKSSSTKPASNAIRSTVIIVLALAGLAWYGLTATDIEAHPQQTINLSSITR